MFLFLLRSDSSATEVHTHWHCSDMAITNCTGDEKQKTIEELVCSAELTEGLHNYLICFFVVNIFLSITAFLGNALILVALHKDSSLHPPSKLLYRNLATTDLCVGIIAEPLVVAFHDVCGERTMEYLPLRICCSFKHRLYFGVSVAVYLNCIKCGQTYLPVTGAKIRTSCTSCNFKANISNCNCFLGCVHCRLNNALLE